MMSPYDAGFSFVFKAWRRAHSWDYVTEAATPKAGKKTSKMGILFASKSLSARLCGAASRCSFSRCTGSVMVLVQAACQNFDNLLVG